MSHQSNGTSHRSNCVAPDKKGLGKVRFRIVCLGCPEIMIFTIQPVLQSRCLVLNLLFLWHIWPFNPFSPFSPYFNQDVWLWTCDFHDIYDPWIHSAHSAHTSINMFGRELVIFVTYMTHQSIQPIQPVLQSRCLVLNLWFLWHTLILRIVAAVFTRGLIF